MPIQVKLESDLAEACQEIDRLHKELSEARHGGAWEKLLATLEFYAEPVSYYDPMHWNNQPEVLIDGGTRARLTLAEMKR